jgi:hypothetical protein
VPLGQAHVQRGGRGRPPRRAAVAAGPAPAVPLGQGRIQEHCVRRRRRVAQHAGERCVPMLLATCTQGSEQGSELQPSPHMPCLSTSSLCKAMPPCQTTMLPPMLVNRTEERGCGGCWKVSPVATRGEGCHFLCLFIQRGVGGGKGHAHHKRPGLALKHVPLLCFQTTAFAGPARTQPGLHGGSALCTHAASWLPARAVLLQAVIVARTGKQTANTFVVLKQDQGRASCRAVAVAAAQKRPRVGMDGARRACERGAAAT